MYKTDNEPNFLKRIFSFEGTISRGEFWSTIGKRMIGYFALDILLCFLIVLLLPWNLEQKSALLEGVVRIVGLILFCSLVPLSRRRLRDAGYSAKSYLWLLVPGIGTIAFFARLCSKSK